MDDARIDGPRCFNCPAGWKEKTLSTNKYPLLLPRLTRREMLQGTAGFGIALMLANPGMARTAGSASRVAFDLGGRMWTLIEVGERTPPRASVPGSPYTNLLA